MNAGGFHPLGALPADPAWQAALVFATDVDGRILLQLRDDFPSVAAPGQWCLFGGQVEDGETLLQAARREFAEETDILLMAAELSPLAAVSGTRTGGILYAFRCTRPITPGQVRLGEGAGYAFLTPAQIGAYPLVASTAAILDFVAAQT